MAASDATRARDEMSQLYRNAVCLAPMVRAGTLPLRLLSLRYGADLVYGEEIIDKRIIATTRVENAVLNTVDYVSKNGDSVVFRTCAEEKAKMVFQIGTADAQLALQAAQHVEQDVAAIDVNMGCPKHFSIQGGMGAALLKNQQVACDIVRTLSANLRVPVSAKIRLLETTEATISFARALQDAGAAAIGLHARYTSERPVDAPHWDLLRPVVEALEVPVLVNGDISTREALTKMRDESGASSFLVARGAMANASVFRAEGMLPYTDVVIQYLQAAAETDNVFQNTKYTLSRMLPGKCDESAKNAIVTVADLYAVKSNEQMFALWGQRHVYDEWQDRFRARAEALNHAAMPPAPQQPAHAYDDEHVLQRQFYCDVCAVQMLSDKDVALHVNGKRHKNKVKRNAAAALSQHVALVEEQQQQPSEAANGEEPAAKRAKVEASTATTSATVGPLSPTDSGDAISVTPINLEVTAEEPAAPSTVSS